MPRSTARWSPAARRSTTIATSCTQLTESPIGFTINQDARFRVRAINATGLGLVGLGDLAKLAIQPGAVFSRTAIADARQLASIAAAQLGRAVDVLPVTHVDTAAAVIDLTLEVR
jgi:hypothetical protein